ncbi:MAG: flagellar basal body rod protein FlgB [Eubacterium sp.]|jgi:flagellar basal-body rod protein FlgB|nr:flagellar basal body rod protein FlgB [Eubacterium sp.]NBI85823.1 flagellar basal body rod protein FlgB [Lachnospiraceae bacterium]
MFSTNVFSYINVLNKAADASWLREQTIVNNLANVNTPEYKRKDVDFQSVLRRELGDMKYITLDSKVDHVDLDRLNVSTYYDHANYSYRMDKNNVDVDTENVELASEKIRYDALTDCMTQEFSRLRTAMSK